MKMRIRIFGITCLLLLPLMYVYSLDSNQTIFETERKYPNPESPDFWKSTVSDVDQVINELQKGDVQIVTRSPGNYPVYLVSYGKKVTYQRTANYNSAVAARKPERFANKNTDTPPIVFIIGPVHGQEMENIAGTLNLIQVAETGKDFRGKAWPQLKQFIEKCRLLIIPVSNPDGRNRCPYDSFVGLPVNEMTRIGQGTRKDGSLYGWPGAKEIHPMKGDVEFLGAYFNNDGINMMHDEFLSPMAKETSALLNIAKKEAPDYIINLHSHGNDPIILSSAYVPYFHEQIRYEIAQRLKNRYIDEGLPAGNPSKPLISGEKYPPPSFNLTSALHHISGAVSILFECPHGVRETKYPQVDHSQIVDIELLLFEQLLQFATEYPRPESFLKELQSN
jgi:hypothetical protein